MAVGCKAYASNEKQAAINATDGNNNTRWETEFADPQWLYSDLGSKRSLTLQALSGKGLMFLQIVKKNMESGAEKRKLK